MSAPDFDLTLHADTLLRRPTQSVVGYGGFPAVYSHAVNRGLVLLGEEDVRVVLDDAADGIERVRPDCVSR